MAVPKSKKRKPSWFQSEFLRVAQSLDAASENAVKNWHLIDATIPKMLRAGRLVLEASNAGHFDRHPSFRSDLRMWWNGFPNVKPGGKISYDPKSKPHLKIDLVADVPPDDGAPFPFDECTDEDIHRLWVLPIFPIVKHVCPCFFDSGAGRRDWTEIAADAHGRLLGKNGVPLRYRKSKRGYRLACEPAYVGDDYDADDWMHFHRCRTNDWAACCRALADMLDDSSGVPDPPPPAWERLKLIHQRSGNDLAELDGKQHRVNIPAIPFLEKLQGAKGEMILASTLSDCCGKRCDLIYKSLPEELKAIIDKPGKGNKGYRMTP